MGPLESVDKALFFELIHQAFDSSFRTSTDDPRSLLYHLHNPVASEMSGFKGAFKDTQLLYVVRHPIQSLESWMLLDFSSDPFSINTKQWQAMALKFQSLLCRFSSPFNAENAVGVRLEDIKSSPDTIMPKIAAFIGISDHPSMYRSEFFNMTFWGPVSAKTGPITGFNDSALKQPLGRLFGQRDITIFEALLWPFLNLYRYTQISMEDFQNQLQVIRPWLDEPLEFEYQIYDSLEEKEVPLAEISCYQTLHANMINAWEILNRDGTYSNMVRPLCEQQNCDEYQHSVTSRNKYER